MNIIDGLLETGKRSPVRPVCIYAPAIPIRTRPASVELDEKLLERRKEIHKAS
jgi:hypothetical protein